MNLKIYISYIHTYIQVLKLMDRKSSNGKGFVDESVSISSSNSSSSNYRQPFGRSVGRSVGEYFASA